MFARDEQTVAVDIVGNAIEHVCVRVTIPGGQQSAEVNHSHDPSRVRIDADHEVRAPDVCEQFALDILELIQSVDRHAVRPNSDSSLFRKRLRIEKADLVCSVAHDQPTSICRQSPTFTWIREFLFQLKTFE